MKCLCIALGLFLVARVFAADSRITVTNIDDRKLSVRLVAPEPMSIEDAQSALFGFALEACNGLNPRYGKYKFESKESLDTKSTDEPDSFYFVQDIECVAYADARPAFQPTQISDAEKQALGAFARSLTDKYFAQIESGDFKASYAMLSDDMQSMSPRDVWITRNQEFQDKAGEKVDGGVSRISVYVDPPDAPGPGIYVAADFEMRYERIPFRCGYVVWHQGTDKEFRLIREETGHLDDQMLAKLSADKVREVRKQYGCVAP